jgi:hypothetical protein
MKAKILDEAIRLVWESLESHLPYTYKKSPEGTAFHIKCVKDYCKLIELLTRLY